MNLTGLLVQFIRTQSSWMDGHALVDLGILGRSTMEDPRHYLHFHCAQLLLFCPFFLFTILSRHFCLLHLKTSSQQCIAQN